ncbi:hypothetical protein DNHGIG_34790 [Collibacillus ludicampi]|uniref:Uncharacterized protein n=1 Tax=Collibacillus ludicampi TaxID=2771369 RepID=A0AAV4LJH2_9BACL|nr:hypothetical protein [Collibacillus ludicampi]GIM47930.1 hypothetical protein DNHGIG_34790 [Collibacillus ludicampi]
MATNDQIRYCLQRCEGIYSDLQTAVKETRDQMALQRLQSALTNMEACINDCRSALDHV